MTDRMLITGAYCCLFVLVALDWTYVGAALFLALMDGAFCSLNPPPNQNTKGKT